MTQAECRLLVQSLEERQLLAEFAERQAKSLSRKMRQFVSLAPEAGTLTRTTARRVNGKWIDWQGSEVRPDEWGQPLRLDQVRVVNEALE